MFVVPQTHQLGHADGGVGVVQMDGDFVSHVFKRGVFFQMPRKQILHRRGHEEVLLTRTQLAYCRCAVVGVQHPRDIFKFVFHAGRALLVAGVEGGQVDVRGSHCLPQAQGAYARRAVASHHHVMGLRSNFSRTPPHRFGTLVFNPPTKANRVADLSARKLTRGAIGKPGVRLFNLAAFGDLLREPAVSLTEAVVKRRQTPRCHRI